MKYKKDIPVYIIEEHFEAFIVWKKLIKEGIISPHGNILFHVDEHADLSAPSFNNSLNVLKDDMKSIIDFTFKEIGIASFIIPAIYLGIIDQYYWFKFYEDEEKTHKKRSVNFVTTYNNEGLKFITGPANDLMKKTKFDNIRLFKYFSNSISSIPANKHVLLDIDLDVFSCIGAPMVINDFKIEITKDEYEKFKNNKYHKIHFSGLYKIDAVKNNKKYYYIVNYYKYIYPSDLKKNIKQITKRISSFVQQLKQKNIHPLIITICRSRYSGYTPNDQWEKIENLLLNELNSIYSMKIFKTY